MDGELEFHNNYYIAKNTKSYLSTEGGAFWFDAVFNYKNEYIELLNTGSDCYKVNELIKGYDKDLNKTKESQYYAKLSGGTQKRKGCSKNVPRCAPFIIA